MENDTNENFDSKIEEIVEDTTTEEESEENNEEESEEPEESDNTEKLSALEKKVKELEAQKKHWQKKATTKSEPKTDEGLSQKDLYALMANKVHEDDIDEVVEYAKLKNISVKEALNSTLVKTILKEQEEKRQTANLTETKTSRKTATEKTADEIIAKARKGEMPENEKDMVKMFEKITGLSK